MAKRKAAKPAQDSGAFEKAILTWKAPEFLRYERGFKWYLAAALLNLGLLGYALWTGAWSMAAVFIVLPLVYALEHRQKPKTVEVKLSHYGIQYGVLRIPYSDMRKFWILHDPPMLDELRILTNKRLHPEVVIPLVGADPSLVRELMVAQVPEWEGKKPSFLDVFTRFLKLD